MHTLAAEVFRVAGGDIECEPNPTPERALEVLHDLRKCYNELLTQMPSVSDAASCRAEGVLLEARNWFEEQAKVISKGGGSSWDLHQVRDMRDRCDSVLQATSAEVGA